MAVTLKGPDLSSCLIAAAAWATAARMRIAPSCETKRSCLPNSRGTAYLEPMSSSHSISLNEQFLSPRAVLLPCFQCLFCPAICTAVQLPKVQVTSIHVDLLFTLLLSVTQHPLKPELHCASAAAGCQSTHWDTLTEPRCT